MKKSIFPLVATLWALLFLTGCFEIFNEEKMRETYGSSLHNPQQDMRFQAFQGRLLTAVRTKDYQTLQRMMTKNFGFDLQSPYEGPVHAFLYWNRYNLWDQLERTLSEGFRPKDNFLVAPPRFALAGADDETPYYGFRAGVVDTRNGYKLAYFVDDNPRDYEPQGPAGLSGGAAAGSTRPGSNPGTGAGTANPQMPRVGTRPPGPASPAANPTFPGNTAPETGSYQSNPAWQRGQRLAP
jgi:hypothetical protein